MTKWRGELPFWAWYWVPPAKWFPQLDTTASVQTIQKEVHSDQCNVQNQSCTMWMWVRWYQLQTWTLSQNFPVTPPKKHVHVCSDEISPTTSCLEEALHSQKIPTAREVQSLGGFMAPQLGPNLPLNSAPTTTATSWNWNIPIRKSYQVGAEVVVHPSQHCQVGLRSMTCHSNFSPYFLPQLPAPTHHFGSRLVSEHNVETLDCDSLHHAPMKKSHQTKAWAWDWPAWCWGLSKTPACSWYPVGQKPKLDWHSPWAPPWQCCISNPTLFQFNSRCH